MRLLRLCADLFLQPSVMRSSAMTMTNASGCTPLLCAAANCSPHAASACLASKLCVETARDLSGRSSVYISCCFGALRTCELLAGKLPPLVAVRCTSGHSALDVAVSRDLLELFEVNAICQRAAVSQCLRSDGSIAVDMRTPQATLMGWRRSS